MIKRIIQFIEYTFFNDCSWKEYQEGVKATERLDDSYFGKEKASAKDLPKLTPADSIAMTQEINRRIQKLGLGIKPKKKRIKVAVDESVGGALSRKIEAKGYEIVCRAGHAETDESWMKRALAEGALFIISPDLDIPSMIERENLPMVWIDFLFAGYVNPTLNADMPKEQKHAIWTQYIHDRIQAKIKFLGKEFGSAS